MTELTQTLRYGSGLAAYPLPVTGALQWQQDGAGWLFECALPRLPAGHLLVPSLSLPGTDYSYTCSLQAGTTSWSLAPMGACARVAQHGPADLWQDAADAAPVQRQLDCWLVTQALTQAKFQLQLQRPQAPAQALLSLAIRPLQLAPAPGATAGVATAARLPVPALTQLALPAAIAQRVCCPTSLAMVAAWHGKTLQLPMLCADCLHQASELYGVWPMAIYSAGEHGLLGSLELFSSLDEAAPLLQQGLPLIASVRFGAGDLPGAPLPATNGHLLVLTGLDADLAYVNDPAAPANSVSRAYPRDAFAQAWLGQRGLGILLVPRR